MSKAGCFRMKKSKNLVKKCNWMGKNKAAICPVGC